MPAIYYSSINAVQLERNMIEKCLEREKIMDGLKALIVKMDLSLNDPTEEQLFKSFKSFILLRNCTISLLKAIQEWQQTFTSLKRPQLMEKDYLVGMISDSDYFSNSKARKYFNFMIGRGNPLLLPRGVAVNSGKSNPPKMVSQRMADVIFKYINADQVEIRNAYQVFIDSLTPFQYKKLYSASAWLTGEAWMPYIDIEGIDRSSTTASAITAVTKEQEFGRRDRQNTVSFSIEEDESANEGFTLAADVSEAETRRLRDASISFADDNDEKFGATDTGSASLIPITEGFSGDDRLPQITGSKTSGSSNGKSVNRDSKKNNAPTSSSRSNNSNSGSLGKMVKAKEMVDAKADDDVNTPKREKKASNKAATHVARYQDDTLLSLEERVAKMRVSTGALKEWYTSDLKDTFLASPSNRLNKPKSPSKVTR